MQTNSKTLIAAFGAVLFAMTPAIANAERVYFLVGTRHVYKLGTDQFAHLDDRKAIEQSYADEVAKDQDEYNKALAGGSTAEAEQPEFNKALEELAVHRDEQLGAIFENADVERDRHPELKIEGDGPYQVMGISFHRVAYHEVVEDIIVVAPWPGYAVVDAPYGWVYGRPYPRAEFIGVYAGWHRGFIEAGRPAFVGIVGHNGLVKIESFHRGEHGEMVFTHRGEAVPHGEKGLVKGGLDGVKPVGGYHLGKPPVTPGNGGAKPPVIPGNSTSKTPVKPGTPKTTAPKPPAPSKPASTPPKKN